MDGASDGVKRWFPKGYFARSKPAAIGDSDADATFRAVGLALTNWELAETDLATLFSMLSGATDVGAFNAIRRAFGAIESSAGRRKAIEAAAEIYFSHDWKDSAVSGPFNGLMAAFRDASARRDEIAHGIVHALSVNNEQLGCFLYPAEYNTQRTHAWMAGDGDPFDFKRAAYRYTAGDIVEYARKFGELGGRVLSYTVSIRKIGGTPAVVLDARLGDGAAEKVERMLAEQRAAGNRNPD